MDGGGSRGQLSFRHRLGLIDYSISRGATVAHSRAVWRAARSPTTRFLTGDLPGAEEHYVWGVASSPTRGLRRYFVAAILRSPMRAGTPEITVFADEAGARMRCAIAAIEDEHARGTRNSGFF